jgi:hypothetical protein
LRVGLSYNAANIFSYNYKDGADLGIKGPNGDLPAGQRFHWIVYGLNVTNEVFGFYNGSPLLGEPARVL